MLSEKSSKVSKYDSVMIANTSQALAGLINQQLSQAHKMVGKKPQVPLGRTSIPW